MPHGKLISDAHPRQTLVDLFWELSNSPGEYIQYDNGYRSWKYTYAQVGLAARHFAARLREANIGKGDKAVFWSENRPEWIAAFWGCILAGVIVVPIDYRTSHGFLRHVQDIVGARLILIGEEVRLPSWAGQPAVWRLAEMKWNAASCEPASVQIERDDIVEIVFTSGATGEPKGVLLNHRNILANIASPERVIAKYAKWFRPVFPLRFLSLIPLSHMFGQVLTMFIVPLIPGIVVLMHGYSPHEIVRQIRTRRVSVMVAVPKILEVLRKLVVQRFPATAGAAQITPHWSLRWWRYRSVHSLFGWKFWAFVVGAAPLSQELEEFWSGIGYGVIQGYGLTETAPVVAFNDPFSRAVGTVGKPVSGVEVKIAPDGEVLVRGDSVTSGYYGAPAQTASAFEDAWFHTGDLGCFDQAGNLVIQGRKKEMIVTPEGLKVFPEDVENVLNDIPGVLESAVVGRERVHAVLVLENGQDPNEVVRRANERLEEHQRIRSVSVWPRGQLPRTESTQKLKRGEIQVWVEGGGAIPAPSGKGGVIDVLREYAPDRAITPETTLQDLGLSSLDRVELLIDLEQQLDTTIDESLLTGTRTVSELTEISTTARTAEFPAWNRRSLAQAIRRAAQWAIFLPLTRMFAHAHIRGRQNLNSLQGPVIFAPNHQSHLDTPLILSALPARYRKRVAVAMWKEYFDAHFSPERHTHFAWFFDTILYWLVVGFFNAFPVPQTEAGARQSLRYIGDLVSEGWSILYFPEGERTEAGEIHPFQPGIGLVAGRLGVPVVPVRLRGVEKVLHRHQRWPHPGPVEIVLGPALYLEGENYAALAKRVEDAVAAM